jgi:excisionase family DNA binding protein
MALSARKSFASKFPASAGLWRFRLADKLTDDMPRFLTLGQAADAVGVTRAAVWQALHNGSLPAHKDGTGRWQIDPAVLEARFATRRAKRQLAGKKMSELAGKPLQDDWRVAVNLLQERVARLEAEITVFRHARPPLSGRGPFEPTARSEITTARDWWPGHDIDLLRKLRDAMGYEPGVRFTRLRQLVDDYNAEAVVKRSRKAIQHKLRLLTRAG